MMLRLLITSIALEQKSVVEPVEENREENTYTSPVIARTSLKSTDRRCSSSYLKKSAA